MNELTQDYVRSLFDYRDGDLYWKVSRGCVKIGDRVGTPHPGGYRRVAINGKSYYVHRIIFLYQHEFLPEFLDHIDGNKLNNSIDNLRGATSQQNNRNVKKCKVINGKPTTSKFKGVSWAKRDKKWRVQITIGGKRKFLGYYDSEIDAALASDKALIERDGKFAVTNKSMGLL